MSVGDPKCAAHGGLLPCGECLRLSGQSFAGNPTPDKMLGSPDLREAAPAQEFVSDALALIRRALAMRDYGDKPVLWEQVWKDIEDAAQRLGNALAVGSERAMDGVGAPLVPAASEYPCSVCGGRLLPYGKACICGGRGTELAEAQGLRERLADLEIALGFYPNISRTVSKAYDEVREALGRSVHAAASAGLTPIQELAQAAQNYLNAEAHVGVTDEMLRELNHRLGSLAGPHLVAYEARVASGVPEHGAPQ